ncbi:hypothetical protein B0H67DRAFT_640502 [Lasiosphaeris hirsuta]|uniref:BTB/POZ domain-containing protein n=1 Tax=Lasiosphaeris hirsuta TaxID=260670 RepID=A0AA40BE37_9PEZI|nr:hypothetical protein B0H67DRAFT_640502 [Lasiosphaeris hirsuta]
MSAAMNPDDSENVAQPKVISIHPDGDVVLIVGNVFRAMLEPPWVESQNLSNKSPKEIAIPEDDPNAMRALCCIVHFRNDLVPNIKAKDMEPPKILQLVVAADKYDMTSALEYFMQTDVEEQTDESKMAI